MKSLRLAFGNPPPFSREAKSFQTALASLLSAREAEK
jgi:hypothetical protein